MLNTLTEIVDRCHDSGSRRRCLHVMSVHIAVGASATTRLTVAMSLP